MDFNKVLNKVRLVSAGTGMQVVAKSDRPYFLDAILKHITGEEKSFKGLLQEYGPQVFKKHISGKLQEFATKGDFPASVIPEAIKKFQQLPTFDNGYSQFFDMRTEKKKRNSFTIEDVEDSLTFNRVWAPGEKLKVYQMQGSSVTVNYNVYGGALGWARTLIDDEEFWTMSNTLNSFRNKYYEMKASLHYALIEATTDTVDWAAHPDAVAEGVVGYRAGRDAETINNAAIEILNAVDGKGYDGVVPTNANFVILAPFELRKRMLAAFSSTMQNYAGAEKNLDFSFTLVTTAMLSATNVYYVILPGNRLISVDKMPLTLFESFDMLSYTDTMAAWFRWGGVVGDTDQVRQCATD